MISDKALGRTTNLRRLPKVEIKWRDASSDGGWRGLAETRACKTSEMLTVGRLTKNSSREVQVAQSVSEHGRLSDTMTIPKGWILGMRYLRGGFSTRA